MILVLFTLFSNASFAFTNYAELTALFANHPDAQIENVLSAIDPALLQNHVLIYHPGGLLAGTPKSPAVGIATPLGGNTSVAEQKSLMAMIYQTDAGRGRSQELEIIEWTPSHRAIHLHRIIFDGTTKKLQGIENDPSRCMACHRVSDDGDRTRPIWDNYSNNHYSKTWGSFPDVIGGGLSFEPRVFQELQSQPPLPRLANISLTTLDTTPGFASTLFAMNWADITGQITQKISALTPAQIQSLKADFKRYLKNPGGLTLLQAEPAYQTFIEKVVSKRKNYLSEKFSRAVSLENLLASAAEKASVQSISDRLLFASADHEVYFQGDMDDLTLVRLVYVCAKNGVIFPTLSMSLDSETYATRSIGYDDHISYFMKRISSTLDSL